MHQIPGLGHVWHKTMKKLFEADCAIIVGFSLSEFDAMAQMQFAEVARIRKAEGRPLNVIVVDPGLATNELAKNRFRRVFHEVEFVPESHDEIDWNDY